MTRRLNVLCVIGSLDAGGAERQVLQMLRGLDRSRFAPVLALAHVRGALLAEVPDDVPVEAAMPPGRGYRFGLGRFRRCRRLAQLLRQHNIDVVYDRTYLATLDTAVACAWRPTARVSTAVADPRVQFELYARFPKAWWRAFSRWSYRTADRVLVNSEGLREQMLAYWSLPPDLVAVQPNAFDFARMERLAEESTIAKSPGEIVILTVGRIDEDKGHRDLLLALDELIHRRGRSELLWRIVGDGPSRLALVKEAAQLGLDKHIVWVGTVANPYPEYQAADMFCLPSRTEGHPNVLVESLAFGIPTIAADCPSGPRDILDGGNYGALVPVRDPMALADAIESICQHRNRACEQARQGRDAVRSRYNAAVVIRQVERHLEEALEQFARRHR